MGNILNREFHTIEYDFLRGYLDDSGFYEHLNLRFGSELIYDIAHAIHRAKVLNSKL